MKKKFFEKKSEFKCDRILNSNVKTVAENDLSPTKLKVRLKF